MIPAPLKNKTIESKFMSCPIFRKIDVVSAVAGLTHDVIHAPLGVTRNYYLRKIKKWLADVVEEQDEKET